MARINIPPIHVARFECRNQIDNWAKSESSESTEGADHDPRDRHNEKFLKGIFQAFQKVIMAYYHASSGHEDKFQRLEEIRQALTEIGFTDGNKTYTIAPQIVMTGRTHRKTCPKGQTCVCGTCQ